MFCHKKTPFPVHLSRAFVPSPIPNLQGIAWAVIKSIFRVSILAPSIAKTHQTMFLMN
ncbi:hypothetical protein B0H19DRAFT_1098156 [Mycena capillaripes]|nr:hypothetical protein B0H19DRAFT_1098156 [Mycena capillaripes]